MKTGEHATKIADERRAALEVGDTARVEKLTRDLDRVYAEKRLRVAQDGEAKSNAVIVKRARIETELERLMSESRK